MNEKKSRVSAFCRGERDVSTSQRVEGGDEGEGRNNQFSDISKCALDDAYLNRPEMVRRERGREWKRRRGKEEG